MPKLITCPLSKIINFKYSSTNGGKFTKSFIDSHKGNIPVYGASLVENDASYGHIEDNVAGVKYFNDCLTWNIDGSTSIFYREGRFSLSEKVIPLIPFDEIADSIDLQYLKYAILYSPEYNSFDFSHKAGKNKLKMLTVQIPITDENTFDIDEQHRMAGVYNEIEYKRNILLKKIEEIQEFRIFLQKDNNIRWKEFRPIDLFIPKTGNPNYTKAWAQNHKGDIPLYSGMKTGAYTYIDTADYEGEYLTWNKDGLAGFIMYHNGKFSISGHRGILMPRKEIDFSNIYLKYLRYVLEPILRKNRKGREGSFGKNEYTTISPYTIKNITETICIPLKADGSFDLEKQMELATKYEDLEKIKQGLIQKIEQVLSISILPDEKLD